MESRLRWLQAQAGGNVAACRRPQPASHAPVSQYSEGWSSATPGIPSTMDQGARQVRRAVKIKVAGRGRCVGRQTRYVGCEKEGYVGPRAGRRHRRVKVSLRLRKKFIPNAGRCRPAAPTRYYPAMCSPVRKQNATIK